MALFPSQRASAISLGSSKVARRTTLDHGGHPYPPWEALIARKPLQLNAAVRSVMNNGSAGSYGACQGKSSRDSKESLPAARLMVHGPIFVENPDGSITEAVPSDAKQSRSKSERDRRRESGRSVDGDSDSSGTGSNAGISMSQEVEFLYSRHERVFMLLLFIQFLLESLYAAVFIVRMSMFELEAMYNWEISAKSAEVILWTTLIIQIMFGVVYYTMAMLALCTKRPKHFQMFAKTCLCGVVGLVLLAYADKFNLPIFFLRLLAYIYARFLQGLTASILLLPPTRERNN